ncbi:suppressor of fused domain protein [Chitinophaga barathri]|uniref:Suppressor of fused domain protein n=1 Tax=Chitinophaga barathri TaxID=1647451 RepID=A0A3N4MAU8_9BACT|nr:suppressor of fused domain protein [Chitinophaga barathri]RPD40721.1 suppressor of fused domain protein [Chitinophaga barathri]
MSTPKVLLQEPNNRDTLYAVVEQDERTTYLYIYPSEQFSERYNMRACWLRNLRPAPDTRDYQAMEEGIAPLLEARYCNHPLGREPLVAEHLSIMWSEEDDGAAVFYHGEPFGFIPGWSLSSEQPASYALDCTTPVDNCGLFPLSGEALYERLQKTSAFWEKWSDEDNNPWSGIQQEFLQAYEAHFGNTLQYYAIDQQQWPPMALAKFEKDDIVYFLSLGVSVRPMPWVELLYNEQAPGFRRMELGLAVSKKDYTEMEIMNMAQAVSGMADSPWRNLSWLGEGHTVGSANVPAGYDSFVLSSALYTGPAIDLPQMEGDTVNLYWASPITLAERESAHSKANGGYELLEQMIGNGITHVVRKRKT